MAFTWQSAGHAFASLFKDVVTVSKKVIIALGGLENEEKVIESLTSLVSPQAAAVEQIAFGALGALVAAVQATETAAGANGVNVAFDASVVAGGQHAAGDLPPGDDRADARRRDPQRHVHADAGIGHQRRGQAGELGEHSRWPYVDSSHPPDSTPGLREPS